MSGALQGKGKAPRVSNWSTEQDRVLVNLLVDKHNQQLCHSGTFKPHVWTDILGPFNRALNVQYDRAKLYNRWKTMKKHYHLYDALCNRSGWGWDSENHVPVASYDGAWAELIALNSEYRLLQGKPFYFKDEFEILCGQTTARGCHAMSSNINDMDEPRRSVGDDADQHEPIVRLDDMGFNVQHGTHPTMGAAFEPYRLDFSQPDFYEGSSNAQTSMFGRFRMDHSEMGSPQTVGTSTPPSVRPAEEEATSPMKKGTSSRSHSTQKKRNKRISDESLKDFVACTREKMDLFKTLRMEWASMSSGSARTSQDSMSAMSVDVVPSIKECVQSMKELPGLPRDVYVRALNLFKDVGNRQLFMELDEEDKLAWIHQNGI